MPQPPCRRYETFKVQDTYSGITQYRVVNFETATSVPRPGDRLPPRNRR